MTQNTRTIPDGTVWKYIYSISHAPHYVQQLSNGAFVGIYAPVENVSRENSVPFGISGEEVREDKQSDYVNVVTLDREETPFDAGVYHDPCIPEGTVWKFDMDDPGKPHYVHQLANGTFVAMYGSDPDQPVLGLSKEQVMEKKADANVDMQPVDRADSPFASREPFSVSE